MIGGSILFLLAMNLWLVLKVNLLERFQDIDRMFVRNVNLTLKGVIDGLTKAGVIEDDKPSVIGQPECHWLKASANKGFVTIVVEDLTDGTLIKEDSHAGKKQDDSEIRLSASDEA